MCTEVLEGFEDVVSAVCWCQGINQRTFSVIVIGEASVGHMVTSVRIDQMLSSWVRNSPLWLHGLVYHPYSIFLSILRSFFIEGVLLYLLWLSVANRNSSHYILGLQIYL